MTITNGTSTDVMAGYWYVASLADGDAHLAEPARPGFVVPRCCGEWFVPIAVLKRPADPAQPCPDCLAGQRGNTGR